MSVTKCSVRLVSCWVKSQHMFCEKHVDVVARGFISTLRSTRRGTIAGGRDELEATVSRSRPAAALARGLEENLGRDVSSRDAQMQPVEESGVFAENDWSRLSDTLISLCPGEPGVCSSFESTPDVLLQRSSVEFTTLKILFFASFRFFSEDDVFITGCCTGAPAGRG